MQQVLYNLYANAGDAMAQGGTLTLSTRNVAREELGDRIPEATAEHYVLLSVTDSGSGMDRKTRDRIFDPFYTTKELGRGTGLGLATVYGIVQSHGGHIEVDSEPGCGATFRIYLEASAERIAERDPASPEAVGGSGTILLVDDEETVLEVAREMLTALGYETLVAHDGTEAVRIYGENRERVDLVILDMVMPGLNGSQTFDLIRSIDADAQVLMASGYSVEKQAKELMARGCCGFLQKPFGLKELSRRVHVSLKG
jgi:CheY-like chemotaxis protein